MRAAGEEQGGPIVSMIGSVVVLLMVLRKEKCLVALGVQRFQRIGADLIFEIC